MIETEMIEAEMRWRERKMEAKDKAEKMAEALDSWINGADNDDIKVFVTALSHKHRTLQQKTFGAFLQFAKVLASHEKTGDYDLRNEFAVRGSAKIMEAFSNEAGVPFI